MKRALITGITGQDGTYLAEYLLSLGYEVWGLIRGQANPKRERLRDLIPELSLIDGDVMDQASLIRAVDGIKPDEVYNLAAISFVPYSWQQPDQVTEVNAKGALRVLEAVRTAGGAGDARRGGPARFYQASSSEMFGLAPTAPQNEATPFHPRSPYGVSKVFGHYITMNYRESYGIKASSGILFNHECVTAETPVFIRRDGLIDVLPIEDVVPHRTDPGSASRYTTEPRPEDRFEVWDAHGWATVTCLTATWNGFQKKPTKTVHRIAARGAMLQATADHVVFAGEGEAVQEIPAGQLQIGDSLALISLPPPTDAIAVTQDEAWLLGLLAAEGYISQDGQAYATNQDPALLDEIAACWRRICGGNSSRYLARSGFENGRPVTQLRLTGAGTYARYLAESLYTRSGDKRVPKRILNAGPEARLAFLRGFNAGDGLKSTPCTYEFQGFKTSSAALAAGLYWLTLTTLKQRAIICVEERRGRLYYQLNLNSPNVLGQKGQHLRRPLAQVVKAEPIDYRGWLFDLATTTGTFHAGIGQGWIHNSPRRGIEFVTRKVTNTVARIKLGLERELSLGNLDARRDWGFAGDYVRAMHLMLQQDEPSDFVIGTGESRSVRELVETAFTLVGLPWEDYVRSDAALERPAEVYHLLADASRARAILGWTPQVTFRQLIERMIASDLEQERTKQLLAGQRLYY